jgi:hypothetical protein
VLFAKLVDGRSNPVHLHEFDFLVV